MAKTKKPKSDCAKIHSIESSLKSLQEQRARIEKRRIEKVKKAEAKRDATLKRIDERHDREMKIIRDAAGCAIKPRRRKAKKASAAAPKPAKAPKAPKPKKPKAAKVPRPKKAGTKRAKKAAAAVVQLPPREEAVAAAEVIAEAMKPGKARLTMAALAEKEKAARSALKKRASKRARQGLAHLREAKSLMGLRTGASLRMSGAKGKGAVKRWQERFRRGMAIESAEHRGLSSDVIGKLVNDHLKEKPTYYDVPAANEPAKPGRKKTSKKGGTRTRKPKVEPLPPMTPEMLDRMTRVMDQIIGDVASGR